MSQKKNPCADGTCRTPTSQRLQVIDTPENGETIGAMVAVSIDGHELKVPLGMTILSLGALVLVYAAITGNLKLFR